MVSGQLHKPNQSGNSPWLIPVVFPKLLESQRVNSHSKQINRKCIMTNDWNLTEWKQWLNFFHVKQQHATGHINSCSGKSVCCCLKNDSVEWFAPDGNYLPIFNSLCFWGKWCLLKEHLAPSQLCTDSTDKLPFKTILLRQNSTEVITTQNKNYTWYQCLNWLRSYEGSINK